MSHETVPGGLCAAKGFTAAGVCAGIKPGAQKPDMMLVVSEAACAAAAVYTQNKVKGAPLAVTREHLADGRARAILCNSGNANTCAPGGPEFARWSCGAAAAATGLAPQDFVVASTGVIGQALPKAAFERGIPNLAASLSEKGGDDAAQAIMTTDTRIKQHAVAFKVGGTRCVMGGACKGSGMININMATMLAFVTSDCAISPALLQKALDAVVPATLNQVSVDGDTSTNDMAVVLANGLAGNAEITAEGADYDAFRAALEALLGWMARALAADGEGATKLLACTVTGATDDATARRIAKTVIQSDLFKAAMFGADANWGRVLCAIGYTPGNFPVGNVSLTLQSAAGSVLVCKASAHHPYSEEDAAAVLAESEIDVLVDMGSGTGTGRAWGCDLSCDYVRINGDYRS